MSSTKKVRVRFAPSPTGGLHLGGVRTVLYNYLFAKQHQGNFIVRIEDTDQTRYVPGAEEYIFNCLQWTGLEPDESVVHGGKYGPYRQSERKEIYRPYAEALVDKGYAYYAFDTPEELERMKKDFRTTDNPSPQYDHTVRMKMRNSLSMPREEVARLLSENARHVIRIKMPENETLSFTDIIRGEVSFNTSVVDDKVLIKADGMPTYHMAVVVDDHLMEISHVFRGEEWLSSTPVHLLLWKYLFGLDAMPEWAHLPLILGPNGKLSKRDGAKYGFPVFAMNWKDPKTNELTEGFKEKGFLPEAFINLLAVLGWNDGSEQELFTRAELIEKFSLERVQSGGAKFDYEKAKWFNHEWIKKLTAEELKEPVRDIYEQKGIVVSDEKRLVEVIELIRDRCHLLPDFFTQGSFFFEAPREYETAPVKSRWSEAKKSFFEVVIRQEKEAEHWSAGDLEIRFRDLATSRQLKPNELLLPLRIMLVGARFGPGVFQIAELLGREETLSRIARFLREADLLS